MEILREYGQIYDEKTNKFLQVKPSVIANYGGLMDIYNNSDRMARFGISGDDFTFRFNLFRAGYGSWVAGASCVKDAPGWSSMSWPWNQQVPGNIPMNNDIYISLVFDGINNKETIYTNGIKENSTEIGNEYWQNFLNGLERDKPFKICVGRGGMDQPHYMHYTKMDCYTIRIYSRALSDDEIKENYKMSVAYHDFLENNGNSD